MPARHHRVAVGELNEHVILPAAYQYPATLALARIADRPSMPVPDQGEVLHASLAAISSGSSHSPSIPRAGIGLSRMNRAGDVTHAKRPVA